MKEFSISYKEWEPWIDSVSFLGAGACCLMARGVSLVDPSVPIYMGASIGHAFSISALNKILNITDEDSTLFRF